MSKQQQQPQTTANTAEHGCGNGFSLVAALSVPGSFPAAASSDYYYGTPSQAAFDRNQLLAIIDEALAILDEEEDDEMMAGLRSVPGLAPLRQQ